MSDAMVAPRRSRSGWAHRDLAFAALVFAVGGTGLAAYNVGPVPVQWLAQFLAFGSALLLGLRYLYPVPGSGLFACFVAWGLVVTLGNAVLHDFASMMPALVTSSYPVFLTLRFVGLLAFASVALLVYWLLREGYRARVLRAVTVIGTVAAAAALYIYVAQIYGWWEPGRSRMGTGAAEQATVFTYAFHRAMGTFREPSHLAEWLVVPLFVSLLADSRIKYVGVILISSALLLTGSLTGILGAAIGLVAGVVLTNPFRGGNLKVVLQAGVALVVAVLIFNVFVVGYYSESKGLLGVLQERIEPILMGDGMAATNRSYVYDYMADQPLPLAGVGLGHSNLVFSAYFGLGLVGSFVSLYFNTVHSVGLVGLLLLALFLGRPLLGAMTLPPQRRGRDLAVLLSAYVAWLVMFAVHSEELTIMFGVAYALLVYEIRERGARGEVAG